MRDFEYYKPTTLQEASDLLLKYGDDAHILNGGTDLLVRIRENITNPKVVVDIKGIKELYDIKYDNDGIYIGACVNLNDMAHHKEVKRCYKVLSEGAKSVGSGQVRNRATMAGNICNASPLADTSTPLLALDATLVIFTPEGEKEMSIHDFFVWVRKTSLKNGEILKAIKIPRYDGIIGGFQKISRRKEVDLSTVGATCCLANDEYRIALASVAPTPIRARKTEEYLKGKRLTNEVIEEACEIAATECAPIGDVRASKEYRVDMVKVAIKRSLEVIKEEVSK
ncbi:FAD binding domain-containing protein [Anaeromicrobium sediminis]|uniref:FAD-binding PCMH-type domain-containing protein n=1 Tax=Anaeromicrobium sediminis TaxID=1478221 RepID=A0A267MCU1_9FIRM|nr:xanthine dehydrogenase family protein subunit M [Anaeromicrobium sediminis]PAB57401.1 hypothetical protein CCE28_19085 [Anaeromicrobium sediminis]